MTLFESLALIAIVAVVGRVFAIRLRLLQETAVQCWHCRTYTDVSEIQWTPMRVDGHQVPMCTACTPQTVPPTAPQGKRLAEVA